MHGRHGSHVILFSLPLSFGVRCPTHPKPATSEPVAYLGSLAFKSCRNKTHVRVRAVLLRAEGTKIKILDACGYWQ